MDIQLAHLQTLAAVVRHGSFSRAARERRLTQPAVSMQVRQLERELGLPLLERVGKRTYTTKAGELLLAHAGRAMEELDRWDLNTFGESERLELGRARPSDRREYEKRGLRERYRHPSLANSREKAERLHESFVRREGQTGNGY